MALQSAHHYHGFRHILVADDHPMFRDVLVRALEKAHPTARVDAVDSFADAMAVANQHGTIDLFLLDLLFPGMNGEVSVSQVRRDFPHASIVILTMLEDHHVADRMIEAGADGFLGKGLAANEMIQSIERVRSGEFVINIVPRGKGTTHLGSTERVSLTPRQIDMLKMVRANKQNKTIARELGLSPNTVRNHVAVVMRLLNVSKRKLIVERAIELGLIEPLGPQPDQLTAQG